MDSNPFRKAERRQAFLKMALTGPSGAGKTFSALAIASGMGQRIALVDSENHSASLYADRFQFDTLEVDPPFTVEKYLKAIQAAATAGYDVLVLDSITHVWKGSGGLLEQKEALDGRGKGNSFTNWASITKLYNQFVSAIISADIHMICTMRSKTDYKMLDRDGKQIPQKVGLAPEQREGLEYEFSLVLDLAMNHTAEASKDRTSLFDGQTFVPTAETGKKLMQWLASAKPASVPFPEVKAAFLTFKDKFGYEPDEVTQWMQESFGAARASELSRHQFEAVKAHFSQPKAATPEMLAAAAIDAQESRA